MMKTGLTIALLAATPVAAQETFGLPQGCEAYVTVQKRGCIVSHVFTCEGDAEGDQRRVDLTEAGMSYVGRIDVETHWVESYQPDTGSNNTLGPTITDPASYSTLLRDGRDTFDFETTSDVYGVTRYVGWDELTGDEVVIDGVTMQATNYQVTAYLPDGTESWSVTGGQFVVPQWGRFMPGTRTITSSNGVSDRDTTPVEFLFPGEDGFLAAKPVYDCSVVLSSLESTQ